MKLLMSMLILIVFCWAVSCREDEAKPAGLSGKWVLVQKKIRRNLSSETIIEDMPSLPLQTIYFSSDNAFKSISVQDTLFSTAKYFLDNTIGDYVGPSFVLFESPNFDQKSVVSSQLYHINQDSLVTNASSGQQLIEYKFYRLR